MAEIAVLKTHIINYSKSKDVYAEYRRIKEENKELQMAKHNLERFLDQQEEEQKQKEKQQSKSGQSR